MNWTFMDAVKYVLGSFGKLPMVFDYISQAPNAIKKATSKFNQSGTHFDMTNSIDKICTAWASGFWFSVIAAVVGILVGMIDLILLGGLEGGIGAAIVGILGLFATAIGAVWGLALNSLYVFIGKKYVKSWAHWVVKAYVVVEIVSLVSFALSFAGTGVSMLISIFTGGFGISSITSIVTSLVSILPIFMVLDGLGEGVPVNNGQQNMYNQPMDNNAGYYQNNVGFNQPNIDINKQNNVQTQQPEMFACPYCNQPITRGQNPCPYCNQMVSWPS